LKRKQENKELAEKEINELLKGKYEIIYIYIL
jgi:hypothetical protein